MGRLLRTAIKDRAIVLVAINEFDRTVGLHRESDVAQHGPGGKLALEVSINAFTVALSMDESADADLGMDLLGGDFHLKLGGIAAITFARDVLRVTSGERKIVSRRSRTCTRGQGKSYTADKRMDGSHYNSPTSSIRNPHQDCSRCHAARQCGFQKGEQRGAVIGGKLFTALLRSLERVAAPFTLMAPNPRARVRRAPDTPSSVSRPTRAISF